MYRVELTPMPSKECRGVRLVELKRIGWHPLDVHAHHVETCGGVANRSPAAAAEQVKEPRFAGSVDRSPRSQCS